MNWDEAEEVGWAAIAWKTSSWDSTVDESVRHFVRGVKNWKKAGEKDSDARGLS